MQQDDLQIVGAWSVAEIDGIPTLEAVPVEVVFASEGRVSGTGGVNRIVGSYTLDGTTLELAPVASTMMAGPPEAMDQETRFLRAFQATLSVTQQPNGLLLSSQDHAVRLVRNAGPG